MAECTTRASTADHIVPRSMFGDGWAGGGSRRWRRVRDFVLARDRYVCQLPVDAAGNYARAADAVAANPAPVTDPDDPRNLRAACALHNRQRSDGTGRAPSYRRQSAGRKWEW